MAIGADCQLTALRTLRVKENAVAMIPVQRSVGGPIQEAAETVLAKNLVVARLAAGITQQELAETSGISRATIAQIEAGCSDPRLSTIVELARALEIPAIFLLTGAAEVSALTALPRRMGESRLAIDPRDVAGMRQHISTGMLKDRVRAAKIGARAVKELLEAPPAPLTAAIFSAILPGEGTVIGALLGDLFSPIPVSEQGPPRAPAQNSKA